MWAQLSPWRVHDGQFPELGVGDRWDTRLEISLDDAEKVADSTALGMELLGDPSAAPGPHYEIVCRVTEDEVIGTYLDASGIVLASTTLSTWPEGTVLRLHSELYGSQSLFSEPPDPLIRSWRVGRLFIRLARAVPGSDPNSWRPDWYDVRFHEVDRMRMWEDHENPFGDGPRMADYLLEIDSIA